MTLLTEKDFETKIGRRRIISTIQQLEIKAMELQRSLHEHAVENERLRRDFDNTY